VNFAYRRCIQRLKETTSELFDSRKSVFASTPAASKPRPSAQYANPKNSSTNGSFGNRFIAV